MDALRNLMPMILPVDDLLGAIQAGLALLILLLCGVLLAMWRVNVGMVVRQLGERNTEHRDCQARK
jgi:hypothetical protein